MAISVVSEGGIGLSAKDLPFDEYEVLVRMTKQILAKRSNPDGG